MSKMQDMTDAVRALWDSMSHPIRAVLLVGILYLFRFIYEDDRRKSRRKWAETGMAMAVTWGLGEGISTFGLPVEASYVVAVGMGTYGINYIRDRAADVLSKKIDKN